VCDFHMLPQLGRILELCQKWNTQSYQKLYSAKCKCDYEASNSAVLSTT